MRRESRQGVYRRGETPEARSRRKFTAGALDQLAQILGATAASVFVVGLVGPYIAALAGPMHAPSREFVAVAVLALLIALATAAGAVVLRGLSRSANDDGFQEPGGPS